MLRHILCSFHPLAAILSQPSSCAEQPSPSLLPALSPLWLRQPEAGLHQRRRQMGNKAKLCKVCNAFKFRMAVDERFCMCCGCTNPTGCCNHPRGKRTCRNPIFKRGAIQCSACRATYKLHRAAGAADAAEGAREARLPALRRRHRRRRARLRLRLTSSLSLPPTPASYPVNVSL